MDLEELLRRYSRGERNFIAIDVPDLLNLNLEGINLTRSNLRGCKLENVNLKNANLSQADLNGSEMTKVNLDKAKLFQTDISECKWIEVSLLSGKLIQSNLSFSFFEICNFGQADLSQSMTQEGAFLSSDFKQVNIEMSFLCMCGFQTVNFESATFDKLSLSENHFFNCNFRNARGAELSDLTGNTLQEVVLPNGEVVDKQIWESFN